ncbi:MAG: glucan biosynthesis protein, partial [Burkholderiales bacterium]
MHRRDVVKMMGAAAFLRAATVAAAVRDSAGQKLRFLGQPQPFDYAALKGRARTLAAQPYQAPANRLPAAVKRLDWDHYQSIRFQTDHALWADDRTRFTIRFFHMGLFFELPVRIHALREGLAREIAYDTAMFDHSKSGLAGVELPPNLGFAGFRVLHRSDPERDIVAFLGASYFRAVGAEKQYGLSARGLAVDTGLPRPEEFPRFTDFWLERPEPSSERLSVYALLDSPSISGAYRFDIVPGATLTMDVDAALYPRKE